MTKNEIKEAIIKVVKEAKEPINPSFIQQKNGWKKDFTDQICRGFGVKGFEDLLASFPELQLIKTEKGDPRVSLKAAPVKNTPPKPAANSIYDKMKILLTYLNKNLYGKEEAVRLALLSAVANESIFFMGPPGTAKSMISRRIAAAFNDFYKEGKFTVENGSYFEYLMNEFSTPDEICGPVDLSKLNNTPSEYERQTQGYLPSAKVAFLDEIWKSGPAILNTLLTIINEKKYHNGRNVQKVPLISLAAASNELPQRDRGLLALWDRFILRVFVNPVEIEDDFYKVIDDDGKNELIPSQEQLSSLLKIKDVESWQEEINNVKLPLQIKKLITAIRKELQLLNEDKKHIGENEYYVSDRRWKKIVHILKTSAFLNGRNAVDLMDCSLIEYAIWNTDLQHNEVGGIIEKILKQNGLSEDGNSITDISNQVKDFKDLVNEEWFEHVVKKAKKPEPIIVKVDNRNCYECTRDDDGKTWYVGQNEVDNWNHYHSIYDENKYRYTNSSFSKNGDKISCYFSFTIKKTAPVPAEDYYEPKLFEPVAKKVKEEAFDTHYYEPYLAKVKKAISDLEKTRKDCSAPFEKNLFAQKKYCDIILEKIDDSIIELKKQKEELETEHKRYAANETSVKYNYELGDLIMKDGTSKKADEEAQEEDIAGIVCLKEKELSYALSYKFFQEQTFDQAQELAKNFGKLTKLPAPYDSGWSLPSQKQWAEIYANKDSVKLDIKGKCWTSDRKDGAPICFNFETGESDHTTANHNFIVYFIRKLAL